MLQGYIVDPESGKVVAVICHGEVFRNGKEGAKIATVLNANLYDLSGNLVGRLDGPHAIDVRTWSLPIAVRNLLEGELPSFPSRSISLRQGLNGGSTKSNWTAFAWLRASTTAAFSS
jgi:hypothetical protein